MAIRSADIHRLRMEIEEAKRSLAEKQHRRDALKSDINRLEQELTKKETELKRIDTEIKTAEQAESRNVRELVELEHQIEKT